ncbi:MAG: TlpA family protein disulfide reductase [Actinobacteria bacterium]|nr:TlpA family protein disulfide reductase [Actinomycetota bacterium]
MRSRRRPFLRYAVCAAAALALTGAVAGCSADANSIAEQAKSGDQKGYVSGDGSIETIPSEKRKAPIALDGPTIDGGTWSSPTDGKTVTVVNVWASWCAPCIAEAPHLEAVWKAAQQAGQPVQFVGINFRDNTASAQAFATKAGVTFPSLVDESGVLILKLQGKAPSVPTTLVLDQQGRIAARVAGATTEATLTGLIDDVLAQT